MVFYKGRLQLLSVLKKLILKCRIVIMERFQREGSLLCGIMMESKNLASVFLSWEYIYGDESG